MSETLKAAAGRDGAATPYLADVLDQPRALSAFLDSSSSVTAVPGAVGLATRPRVIISGMGSSHYAGFGLWASLTALGVPAWWIETAQLLELADGLVIPDSLLWLTSQSGESAEIVALLDRLAAAPVHVVGVTNNAHSALGSAAHTSIDLVAGHEATVTTKSYVNTLAASRLVAATLSRTGDLAVRSLRTTVETIDDYVADFDTHVAEVGDFGAERHLLLTGRGAAAASAQAAGLVIKEAAKVPVEGLTAGALRHGVIELAGPNLAVAFFDHGPGDQRELNRRLVIDLERAGTQVASISSDPGHAPTLGSRRAPAPAGQDTDLGIRDALAFQTLSFALAGRTGVTAGEFSHASKITDVL